MEDRNLTAREGIKLVKDFTIKQAHDEVKFCMGMVAEDQQTLEGLINHLKSAFHLGEIMSELISDSMVMPKEKINQEDVFTDDIQILVRKIIAQKASFRVEANEQLKHQYALLLCKAVQSFKCNYVLYFFICIV